MLATILKSKRATETTIDIIKTFANTLAEFEQLKQKILKCLKKPNT
jgi:hypothetical protein